MAVDCAEEVLPLEEATVLLAEGEEERTEYDQQLTEVLRELGLERLPGEIGPTAMWRGELTHCAYQNHIHRLRAKGDEGRASILYVLDAGCNPASRPLWRSWEQVAEDPQNGLYKPPSLYGTGTPIVRINDYEDEGGVVTRVGNRVQLTPVEVAAFRLSQEDILINRVNSLSHLGKAALVGELRQPTVFESNMMRFAVDTNRVLPEYTSRFLCTPSVREHFRAKSKRAVAQSSINQQDVKSLPCSLPTLAVQCQIVASLSAVEQKIDAEEKRQAALQALFKSMLHHLMTGKVRVKDL